MPADTGRALTCSTTFVSWGTTVTIREPRSTLRRVSLLGAAALLRPAWRAEDNIYQHTWHVQHSAPVRTSYAAGAWQGCTRPTKPPIQQRSSAIPDRMRTCSVLITVVPVHKEEVCPLYNRMTELNRPDKSSTERCKGPVSCHPAFTKVITLLVARHHQKLFLQWSPLYHTPSNSTDFFFWTWREGRECRARLLKTV